MPYRNCSRVRPHLKKTTENEGEVKLPENARARGHKARAPEKKFVLRAEKRRTGGPNREVGEAKKTGARGASSGKGGKKCQNWPGKESD